MKLSVDERGDVLVVTVNAKRIDAATAVAFRDALVESASSSTAARVVVNLDQVELVDSSGLGALVSALKQIRRERPAALCGLQRPVDNLMKLTRMDRMFTIHTDVDAAVAAPA